MGKIRAHFNNLFIDKKWLTIEKQRYKFCYKCAKLKTADSAEVFSLIYFVLRTSLEEIAFGLLPLRLSVEEVNHLAESYFVASLYAF
jgi:hypothetical protein